MLGIQGSSKGIPEVATHGRAFSRVEIRASKSGVFLGRGGVLSSKRGPKSAQFRVPKSDFGSGGGCQDPKFCLFDDRLEDLGCPKTFDLVRFCPFWAVLDLPRGPGPQPKVPFKRRIWLGRSLGTFDLLRFWPFLRSPRAPNLFCSV